MKKRNTLIMGIGMLGIASTLTATSVYAADTTQTPRMRPHNDARHQAVHDALIANDYTAFKAAIAKVQKPPDAPEITEAIFAKMVEAEKLRQSGDFVGAEKIMKDLGLARGPHESKKHQPPQRSLSDVQKTAWEKAHMLMEQGKNDEAKALLVKAGIAPPTRAGQQQ